jgi:hypothetical protein
MHSTIIRSRNTGLNATKRWRWISILPLLAMSGTIAVISASPAAADSTSAMNHCTRGAPPQIDASVNLAGSSPGVGIPTTQNPPNILNPGDAYRVDAWGVIGVDWWGHAWDPGGDGYLASKGWPFPDNIRYSDVLRFLSSQGWVDTPPQATQFGGCRQWGGRQYTLSSTSTIPDSGTTAATGLTASGFGKPRHPHNLVSPT